MVFAVAVAVVASCALRASTAHARRYVQRAHGPGSHLGGESTLGLGRLQGTLSAWAVEASGQPDFRAKRVRSGVETLLASARISSDIRGRLQSHGISGVQARHYDGHDYVEEKRQALETLFRLLDAPEASNVVQLKTA